MTKSNNEWVPDVGQRIGFIGSNDEATCLGVKGDHAWIEYDNGWQATPLIINLRPIKTEAEKRRESMLEDMIFNVPRYEYEHLYVVEKIVNHTCSSLIDAGWIKPKPLTDDVIKKFIYDAGLNIEAHRYISLVLNTQAYIRGEG